MTFTQALFGLRGRLNRAAYNNYSLLVLAALLVAAGVLVGVAASGRGAAGPLVAACALGLPVLVAAVWAGVALNVKRLHDMDLGAAHLIWVHAAPVVVGAVVEAPGAGLLGSVVGFGIMLWLCCAPGTGGPNRFGEPRASVPAMAQATAA